MPDMARVLRRYGKRFGLRVSGFASGVLDIFDLSSLFGTRRYQLPYSSDPWRADGEALRSDWEAVGNDLRAAFMRYDAEVAGGQKEKAHK